MVLLRFDEAGGDLEAREERNTKSSKPLLDEDHDEIDDADTFFIPLTWPRIRSGEFYAPSDPEWKEFVKIARDKQRLPALRGKNIYCSVS